MTTARIIWQISGHCDHGCWYCLPKYRNNALYKETDDYLRVIDLLQNHGQRSNITDFKWKFKGGEPLKFPGFNIILKSLRKRPSWVAVETSGGESWFDLLEVIELIDEIILTHHHWQQESVVDYAIDLCKEKNKKLKLLIPLEPGKIKELREQIVKYQSLGIECNEQLLVDDHNNPNSQYTLKDLNIYYGRPEDWTPPPPEPPSEPQWQDPRVADGAPSYTGKPCYAGVDYLYIDSKGFAAGSECGGRDIGNVFTPGWLPPDTAFPCSMMYCRSDNDKRNIRIPKD